MTDSPSDENRSDEDLIQAILHGESELYRILVERHQQQVFALVFRQVGNRAVAAEITQESLVKAYLGLKSFRFASKFSSWLIRIALNSTNSYFTSKAYKQQLLHESFEVQKHDMSTTDHNTDDSTELKLTCFRNSLASLKPQFREVLTLCALEGRSYEEAAAVLEIPVGTVRSRLNTARLKLKDAIAAQIDRSPHHES